MPRYRKKPLAQYEFGTRIYAPSGGEGRYRVVTSDPITGQRVFHKFTSEDDARAKAEKSRGSWPPPPPSATDPTKAPAPSSGWPPPTARIT